MGTSLNTLIATLGGQPQVVTFTLDLLLARDERINEVLVIWLDAGQRYRHAFERLQGEFIGDRYQGQPIHFRHLRLEMDGRPLPDLYAPTHIDAAWGQIDVLLSELKAQRRHLHLSLSGGRRILALLALSAAMRHFTPSDRAWHIYTPDAVRASAKDGRLMHVERAAGLRLIAVPVHPLGAYYPSFRDLLGQPPRVLASALTEENRQRCRRVWATLSPRERDALQALAFTTTRQEAAQRLHISLSTIDTHKQTILRQCRQHWPPDTRPDVHFLRNIFRRWLDEQK